MENHNLPLRRKDIFFLPTLSSIFILINTQAWTVVTRDAASASVSVAFNRESTGPALIMFVIWDKNKITEMLLNKKEHSTESNPAVTSPV